MAEHASTGLAGLDAVLNYLRKGDNVVWQVDSVEDYLGFVTPFVRQAVQTDKKVVYMRFATHKPIIENNPDVTTPRRSSKSLSTDSGTNKHVYRSFYFHL